MTEPGQEREPDDGLHIEVSSLATGASPSRRTRRPWVRLAQATSVLAIVGVVLYALVLPHFTLGTRPAPPPTSASGDSVTYYIPPIIRYTGQPLSFPVVAAWSPDSARFAVIAYLACTDPNASPNSGCYQPSGGVLAIYADPSQPPLKAIDLDALVKAQGLSASLKHDQQQVRRLAFAYSGLSWSPDGTTIALTYDGEQTRITTSQTDGGSAVTASVEGASGLILVPTATLGSGIRTINATSAPRLPPLGAGSYPVPGWNVRTGAQITDVYTDVLAYRWQADHSLAPLEPIAQGSAAPPVGPTDLLGNYPSGTTFTLWQQGSIDIENPSCGGGATPTSAKPYFTLNLWIDQPVWSPDGAVYLPETPSVYGRVDVPVRPALLNASGICSIGDPLPPLLPVRDAGLRTVLTRLDLSSGASLDWSPDGARVLAVTPSFNTSWPGIHRDITLLDCASGKVLKSVTISAPGLIDGASNQKRVAWSPDGQRVLLLDMGGQALMLLAMPQAAT